MIGFRDVDVILALAWELYAMELLLDRFHENYQSTEPNASSAELISNPYIVHDKALAIHDLSGSPIPVLWKAGSEEG